MVECVQHRFAYSFQCKQRSDQSLDLFPKMKRVKIPVRSIYSRILLASSQRARIVLALTMFIYLQDFYPTFLPEAQGSLF